MRNPGAFNSSECVCLLLMFMSTNIGNGNKAQTASTFMSLHIHLSCRYLAASAGLFSLECSNVL